MNRINDINNVINDINKYDYNRKKGYSFLLRVKNEEDTIRNCILSIIKYADEIIVVLNNSTDKTEEIVLRMMKNNSKIKLYYYDIDVPRYGLEHSYSYDNINTKNNTLTNYYNWVDSKSSFNKKIKWDGDFVAIEDNLLELLNHYKKYEDEIAVNFSGLTLFKNGVMKYVKNNSYYDEYRLFLNKNKLIWSDNIISGKNYCETSLKFGNNCGNKTIWTKPIFYEIKDCNKDEFSSRSDGKPIDMRDKKDFSLMKTIKKGENIRRYPDLIKYFDGIHKRFNYSFGNIIITEKYIDINEYREKFKIPNYQISKHVFKYDNNRTKYILDNSNNNLNLKKYIRKDDTISIKKNNRGKNILLVIDIFGWAFHNICNMIKKYDTKNNYTIVLGGDIKNKLISDYDYVILFWYDANFRKIVDNLKLSKTKIILCLYDSSIWVNNPNKDHEKHYQENISHILKKSSALLCSSDKIINHIKNDKIFNIRNKIVDMCYDGVDTKLFKYVGYDNSITTKDKLVIGWIGNSNPNSQGINKGYQNIKNVVEKLKDKFIFNPQDSFKNKIEHKKIPEYIKNIDIIVCFSENEGTPNQILEAISSGKCWVSTNVGIVSNIKGSGVIIKRDENMLEKALLMLYKNRKLIINYGRNGYRISKEWDWSIKTKQFYNILSKI